MLRAPPLGIVGQPGQYAISSQANTVAVAGTNLFQYITGADFTQIKATDDLVFTASQAKLVASRTTKYSIRIYASLFGILTEGFIGMGIDLNGDILGQDVLATFGNFSTGFNSVSGIAFGYGSVTTERILDNLVVTDAIRPVFAFASAGFGVTADTPSVDEFIMIATSLPEF